MRTINKFLICMIFLMTIMTGVVSAVTYNYSEMINTVSFTGRYE